MIRIINADVMDGLRQLPDKSVQCVVTSPPYNIGIDYGEYKDDLPWDQYYDWCRDWLKEIYRVMTPDGRLCLNHYLSCGNARVGRHFPLMKLNSICCEEVGFHHHALILWYDITRTKYTAWGSWLSASAPYINSPFEGILVLYKDQWKRSTSGISTISKQEFMDGCSGIWKIGTEHSGLHPAAFPEKLPERCINLFTYIGDTVLDPFGGSGTVAKVARDLKRDAILIELNPDYIKIANERLRLNEQLDQFCEVES